MAETATELVAIVLFLESADVMLDGLEQNVTSALHRPIVVRQLLLDVEYCMQLSNWVDSFTRYHYKQNKKKFCKRDGNVKIFQKNCCK